MTTRKGALPLVETAYQWLADHGMGHFNLRAIANEAGCSLGTLTYHFPAKEDLLEAIIDIHITPVMKNLPIKNSPQDPLAEIKDTVKAVLPLHDDMDIWWRARVHLHAFRNSHPRLRSRMRKAWHDNASYFGAKFERLVRQGTAIQNQDPEKLCRHYLLMLEGAGLTMLQLNMPERAQYGEPILAWLDGLTNYETLK